MIFTITYTLRPLIETDVIKVDEKWKCNCADAVYRHVCCKHAHAVEYSIKIREVREQKKVVLSPVTVSDCRFCHSL